MQLLAPLLACGPALIAHVHASPKNAALFRRQGSQTPSPTPPPALIDADINAAVTLFPPWCPDQCSNPRPCNPPRDSSGALINLEIGINIGPGDWCCDDDGGTVTVTQTASRTTVTVSDTVTVTQGPTVTVTDGTTVTVTDGTTVTVTEGGTVTITDGTTVTVSDGTTVTQTDQDTLTLTQTDENTVTVPTTITTSIVTTVPTTIVTTISETQVTTLTSMITTTIETTYSTTQTVPGPTVTNSVTQPPSTTTYTTVLPGTTITQSGSTITLPGSTVTTTATVPPGTETVTTTTSDITMCPTRTADPNYRPASPIPSNYLWGCPPGQICEPDKQLEGGGSCNFEVGPPAPDYLCRPEQCKDVPKLLPPQNWEKGKVEKFIVSEGYFNLDPRKFGLDYDVFVFQVNGGNHSRRANPLLSRRQDLGVPGPCFEDCNNVMLEAESSGKSPDLCDPDSAFSVLLENCELCVEEESEDDVEYDDSLLPDFQQFLNYCDTLPDEPTPTNAPDLPPSSSSTSPGTQTESDSDSDSETDTPTESPTESSTATGPSSQSSDDTSASPTDGIPPTPTDGTQPTPTDGMPPTPPTSPGDGVPLPTNTDLPPPEYTGSANSLQSSAWGLSTTVAAGLALLTAFF